MKKLIFICITLFIVSCSNEEIDNNKNIVEKQLDIDDNSLLIDRSPSTITVDEARKISNLFFATNENQSKTKSQGKDIDRISSVIDSLNNKLLYIVNYSNNGGYIIISATKKYQPILAYSEEGSFNLDKIIGSGAEALIDLYKKDIRDAIGDQSDSLRIKYASEWNLFEKKETNKDKETKSYFDIQNLREAEIRKRESQGYECHSLGAAMNFMDSEQAKGFIRDICDHTYPEYNCNEVNILLIKRTNEKINNLINTNWGQGSPFNIDAPNKLAGCAPIAIGQIANYHRWPNSYNWDQINSIYGKENDETYRFIKDIRNFCKVKYNKKATGTTRENEIKCFQKLGYNVTVKDYNIPEEGYNVINELKKKNPVFMTGYKENHEVIFWEYYTDGHAWICDGYKKNSTQYAVSVFSNELFAPNKPMEPKYVFHSGFTQTNIYLHMNWGWSGDCDGWYYVSQANPTPEDNFYYDRKVFYIQKN